MITEQSVIDELNAKPEVQTVDVTDGAKKEGLYQVRNVQYSTTENDVAKFENFKLLIVKPETADEAVFYHTSIPDILKPDAPATTPPRQQIMPDADIITAINAKDHLISDTSFTVRISNSEDIVTARVIDSKDGLVTTKQFSVYDDKGTPVLKEVK